MQTPGGKENIGLRQSVISTVAWFEVFGYPLTLSEVFRYLPVGPDGRAPGTLSEVAQTLDSPDFVCEDGHYRLASGESSVRVRQARYRMAKRKLVRARRVANLFGKLPSVRMVAVCNSLAVGNAEDDSDIDLFLVCRPGTLWLTRLLLAGTLKLLRLRPTPNNHKDKLCLSFWVSESRLDLSRFSLEGHDPYMDYWIATLLPLYDAGGVFERFRSVNSGESRDSGESKKPSGSIERFAKHIQMRKFPESIRAIANMDSRVVISDEVLKFHVNDRRESYREQHLKNLEMSDI